jgi:hypothetical protein
MLEVYISEYLYAVTLILFSAYKWQLHDCVNLKPNYAASFYLSFVEILNRKQHELVIYTLNCYQNITTLASHYIRENTFFQLNVLTLT